MESFGYYINTDISTISGNPTLLTGSHGLNYSSSNYIKSTSNYSTNTSRLQINSIVSNSIQNQNTIITNDLNVTNNLNVVVVVKRTYYEILMNDSDTIFLIHVKNGHRYGYENNAKEKIETIRKTFLKIENNNKPLKAISGYKVSELIELCNKLDIKICDNETGKSKSKQNLYESIVQYFHFH
jgi:hypothetical protein